MPLLDRLQAAGVAVHWNSPRSPADFDPDSPGWLFDCRGLGARSDWKALRGVRGEVVRIHAPGVSLTRPTRLLHPRYPLYIAPKPGDVFVIGATEIESDDLSPASVRSTLELLSAAYTVHTRLRRSAHPRDPGAVPAGAAPTTCRRCAGSVRGDCRSMACIATASSSRRRSSMP